MSGRKPNIQEEMDAAFRKKLERILPKQSIIGKVKAVNSSNFTCDVSPVDEGAAYNDVRLQAIIDTEDTGILFVPKVGSYVMVSIVENDENNAYVAQYTEVDVISFKIKDVEFHMDKDGVRIKKGNESLLPIVEAMIDELNKIIVVNGTTINVAAMNVIKERFKQPLKA